MVQTYLRGNDYATINIFGQKYFDETFWFKPIPEEMILQIWNILDQKIIDKTLWLNLYPRKWFCYYKKWLS